MESWCQESGELLLLQTYCKKKEENCTQAIIQAPYELFNPSQAVTKSGAVSSARVQPYLVIT